MQSGLATMRANAGNFDQWAPRRKTRRPRGRFERLGCASAGRLADCAALLADEEHHELVVTVIMRACHECIAALDAMDQAVLAQKIERAVDRDRRRPVDTRHAVPRQMLDDLVGAKWFMAGEQRLEYLTTDRRQALSAGGAMRFRMRDRGAGATLMIVARRGEDHLGCIRHRSVILMPEPPGAKLTWPSREHIVAAADRENVTVPM